MRNAVLVFLATFQISAILSFAAVADPEFMTVQKKAVTKDVGGDDFSGGFHHVPKYVTYMHLEITARTDNLTISTVSVNRGNCSVYNHLPATLKFGEKLVLMVNCDPIEMSTETDQGPATFNFSE